MKKLVFMFVAMAAMSLVSCGGASNAEATAEDSTAVEATEVVETPAEECCDSVAATEAPAEAAAETPAA